MIALQFSQRDVFAIIDEIEKRDPVGAVEQDMLGIFHGADRREGLELRPAEPL